MQERLQEIGVNEKWYKENRNALKTLINKHSKVVYVWNLNYVMWIRRIIAACNNKYTSYIFGFLYVPGIDWLCLVIAIKKYV
jgi:hypothetical protein